MSLPGFISSLFKRNPVSMQVPDKLLTSIDSGPRMSAMPFVTRNNLRRLTHLDLLDYAKSGYSPDEIMDVLCRAHPDVSQAVWEFTTLCNTGLTLTVENPGGSAKRQQDWLNDFVRSLDFGFEGDPAYTEDRSLERLVNTTHASMYVRGAACCELLVDRQLTPLSFYPRPPTRVEFVRDPKRPDRHIPYWNNGSGVRVPIDNNRFFYQAVGYDPDDPYGTSMIEPVLTVVFFQVRLLTDLAQISRRVGFPRVDVAYDEEIVIANAKRILGLGADISELKKYVYEHRRRFESNFQNTQPEDPLCHDKGVNVSYLESKYGAQAVDATSLMELLSQQICSACKMLPSLMGRSKRSAAGNSDEEVALFMQFLAAVQRGSSRYFGAAFTTALRLNGMRGYVVAHYPSIELRSPTEVEQWVTTRIHNQAKLCYARVITLDEFRQSLRRLPGAVPAVVVSDKKMWEIVEVLAKVDVNQIERSGPSTQDRDSKNKKNNTFDNSVNARDLLIQRLHGGRYDG